MNRDHRRRRRQYFSKENEVEIEFGDLPVNLRQEILNLIRSRNINGSEITVTGITPDPHPLYDFDPDSNGFH